MTYIAHATSQDGISWRRVKNAIFVGDPGEWDDDMLWTMHVRKKGELFQMYYTGLRRSDRGQTQKIGLAESTDLMTWTKKDVSYLPLKPSEPYYETPEASPRKWTSFRDPFLFTYLDQEYLLMCARVPYGPVSRRGCVGLARWEKGKWMLGPPLLFPGMYDDIECPCLCKVGDRFYLIGSIREDIKVRYWFADDLTAPYRSFHSDVLLPQGNYAARVVRDGEHLLIYNFYYTDRRVNSLRVLPPPKQLGTDDRGRLVLKSFYRWQEMTKQSIFQKDFGEVTPLLGNKTGQFEVLEDRWTASTISGYELFLFEKPTASIIWEGDLLLEGLGKFGLILDADKEGNGYFIPFDFVNGYVMIRSWGFNPVDNRQNFIFSGLQSNLFNPGKKRTLHFRIIRYGNYIELAIDDVVKLTLMDYTYEGSNIGMYSASSSVVLEKSIIHLLSDPVSEYASQENVLSEQQMPIP